MPLYWDHGQVKFVTIGFELEFDSTFKKSKPKIIELLKNEYGNNKVKQYSGYKNSDGNSWDIKKDSSAGSKKSSGWEIASPKFRIDEVYSHLEAVRIVYSFTNDDEIWSGCGFHVHLGLGNVDRDYSRNFILMMMYFQKAILTFMPESRRDNEYALENDYEYAKKDFDKYINDDSYGGDRYHLINLTRYNPADGFVVELRHHSGTREPEKVYLWIRILLTIFAYSEKWSPPRNGCGYFYELYNYINSIDPYAARWMSDRREKFVEDNGIAHGLVDDLNGMDNSIFYINKFTLKDMVLLTSYGKSTTKNDWLRKITELKGDKFNASTINTYTSQLQNEGLIKRNTKNLFVLTADGKKRVKKILRSARRD